MKQPSQRSGGALVLLVLLVSVVQILLVVSPVSAQADKRWLTCEYVEAGPAGPVGNELLIAGNDNAEVRREGDSVLVGTSAANGPRQFAPLDCGEQATVANLDRIVYHAAPVPPRAEHQFLLDERGGPLGPGVSPEPVDPEIEVWAIFPPQAEARPRVQLLGGEGRDRVTIGGGSARLGLSLDPWPPLRGVTPDPDLIVAGPPRTIQLKVHGGASGDVLDARGLDRHPGLLSPGSLFLAGDEGKDAMLGSERGDVLEGGSGPDRLFGRGGRDFLYPSAGADVAVGGPGADFLSGQRGSPEPDTQPDSYFGGPGADHIDARRGGADSIACGAGFDEALADREDTWGDRSCERLRGPASNGPGRSNPRRRPSSSAPRRSSGQPVRLSGAARSELVGPGLKLIRCYCSRAWPYPIGSAAPSVLIRSTRWCSCRGRWGSAAQRPMRLAAPVGPATNPHAASAREASPKSSSGMATKASKAARISSNPQREGTPTLRQNIRESDGPETV